MGSCLEHLGLTLLPFKVAARTSKLVHLRRDTRLRCTLHLHQRQSASSRTSQWPWEIQVPGVVPMPHGELSPGHAPFCRRHANIQPWGNLQAVVQESLELAEAVDIQQLPGLRPLWTKHNLNIQGDANHFVNTLWNLSQSGAFHYRFAEIQPGGYLTDHIQQPILVPYPDDWPDSTNLQDLFNGWANTGLGQYLMGDKPVLVSHITRNTVVDDIPTKHSKILNTYGTFTVPRSLDGFARTSSEFVPAALICHRGPSHNTGHYFAILIYRDLMWIADDGKPPIHLERLTPQLASQVTQVWAIHIDTFRTTQQVLHSLPPPEDPDFDPPLRPSPEKRPRLEQQHNQLHFANVTNFGKQVLDWYWSRQSEVYILVEIHLEPPMMKVTSTTKNGRSKAKPKGSKGSSAAFEVVSWPGNDHTEIYHQMNG